MSEILLRRSRSLVYENLPSKSGWILKRTHGLLKKFKKRWMILENRNLFVYRDTSLDVLKIRINFDQVSCMVARDPRSNQRMCISFKNHSQKFYFKGECGEIAEWEKEIGCHIQASFGSKTVLTNFEKNEKFWKFFIIKQIEFSLKAETGDLIFFRGKTALCSALRSITKCEFDHIALVYILNNILYIFESTRSTGVCLLSWEEFINRRWFALYERIGYRKLELQRNQQFFEKSEEFVTENEGKPYKLLKFRKNDNGGYFCSELVAEFYKRTGLLYQNTPANRFMTKDFLVSKKLKIIQGELGPLQDIRFNLN